MPCSHRGGGPVAMSTIEASASHPDSAARVRAEMLPSERTIVPSRSVATTLGLLTTLGFLTRLGFRAASEVTRVPEPPGRPGAEPAPWARAPTRPPADAPRAGR